jgi:surface protein
MKKIIYIYLIGILFSINLLANQNLSSKLNKIPLSFNFLSFENGGNKTAIDAYSDGIGLYVTGEDKSYKAMNELVFKYGEEAKKAGETLKDFVISNGNNQEQELANLLGTNSSGTVIGTSCDDGNPNTENDVYIDTNGSCQGAEIAVKNTIECYGEPIGSEILVDGISYLVVNNDSIKNNLDRAETLCTSNVTNMNSLFRNSSFNGDISHWDVSNVISMGGMFGRSIFNGDISNWNVSNVEDMYNMFKESKFNNNSLKDWDIKKQYGFYGMFSYSDFNGDLSGWDVSKTFNMEMMFKYSKFNNDSIKNWNIESVRNANSMFEGSLFNQDISNWNTINLLYYGYFSSEYLESNYYPIFVN